MFACDFAAIWFKWWEGEFVVENILDSCIMQSKPRTCNLCVCVRVRELHGVKRESTLGLTVLTLSLSLFLSGKRLRAAATTTAAGKSMQATYNILWCLP